MCAGVLNWFRGMSDGICGEVGARSLGPLTASDSGEEYMEHVASFCMF